MPDYLSYQFVDSSEFISTFDEAPLWSARFGFLLLDEIELKHNMTVLDVASGAGFPLIELAERLGSTSKIYGIDPWTNANLCARKKIEQYGLTNIEIIEQSADKIPFDNDTLDLITSNLGINNFENRNKILEECYRVMKPEGKLAITTNLFGHWKEFYSVFEETLIQLGRNDLVLNIRNEQLHRDTPDSLVSLFTNHKFEIVKWVEDSFCMNFVDGTAFLNHHFVKCGWMESWLHLFPEEDREHIFTTLERNLNHYAGQNDGLKLTILMAYIEGQKTNSKIT